ncbi:DUF1573 domain-containing protein [Candidatus Bipolaricaulota bacterium]|nr:DUF1573 domain-containing protein [Candidatus Bipolaricaulota bacterium]
MNKAVLLALIIIVILGITLGAAPRIAVDIPVHDFGSVVRGTFVTHTFLLRNTGTGTLTIRRMWGPCPCATAAPSSATLAPGESVELVMIVDTARFLGGVSQRVLVESNDPHQPRLTLRMTGRTTPSQPYHIAIGDLKPLFYLLIDLREPEAHAAGHLLGAINIPYVELAGWLTRLPRGVLIILYDQDGSLGDRAARMMNARGFPDAMSLLGGFAGWVRVHGDRFVFSTVTD